MELNIKNITAEIENKEILTDLSLNIKNGETHVIMGPNGVGKSTLSKVIMNAPGYTVTSGDILVNGKSILNLKTDERSRLGIFLAMQNPIEIEGITNQDFLRTAISSKNNKKVGLYDFIKNVEKSTEELKMSSDLIHRELNIGFSGGEKKKNEVLQIKLLEPSFIILDELDSGLDVDSVKIVCENLISYKNDHPDTSFLIITHHNKILEYLTPDYVHILYNGKIIASSDYSLAVDIETNGYNKYINKTNIINKENNNE